MIRKTSIISWIVRIMNILALLFMLLMALGEGFNPGRLRPQRNPSFSLFPVDVCIGI